MTTPTRNTASHAGPTSAPQIVLVVLGGLVVLGVLLFSFGEDLFGSSRGTIDSYNREVLDTCDVPPDSTLVRTYTLAVSSGSGRQVQGMSYIYASPLEADDVGTFYGVDNPGIWTGVSTERACKFGNVPVVRALTLVVPETTTPLDPTTETAGLPADAHDEFWGGTNAKVTDLAEVPAGTRSFLSFRLAQRYREGLIGF